MRIELNSPEISRLLRAEGPYEGVGEDLVRRGRAIADAAGDGFEVESFTGANRFRVIVFAATDEARRTEATERVLVRAMDAGRG
jgi:hypothetical protein